jgi:hypothetical protein
LQSQYKGKACLPAGRTLQFPLFKDFLRRAELAVFLLENSPFNFREIPVREENKVFSSLNNTGEESRKGGEQVPMTQLQQQLKTLAHWRGSEKTADAVREEIARRWGDEEAAQYDPLTNCFTIQTWNKLGYRVKKGERAIRSITYVEAKDPTAEAEDEDGEVRIYPKTVYLFYRTQVEKR